MISIVLNSKFVVNSEEEEPKAEYFYINYLNESHIYFVIKVLFVLESDLGLK